MEFHKALGLSSFFLAISLWYLGFAHSMRRLKWFTAALYLLRFMADVVPSPLPFEFALTSLCCQNLTVNEPFVDMLWGFAFMYRYMLVKYVPRDMKVLV